MKNTHKSKNETKSQLNGLRSIGLILAVAALTSCTTLGERLTHQSQALMAALADERKAQARKDLLALTFTQHAQSAIHQPQGTAEADRWLTLTESLLQQKSPTDPLPIVSPQTAPVLATSAVKVEQVDQARTDQILNQLTQTTKIAVQQVNLVQQDSGWFGLTGLIRYCEKFASNVVLLLISLLLASAVLYIAATFYPPFAPVLGFIDSCLLAFFGQIVSVISLTFFRSQTPPPLPTATHS